MHARSREGGLPFWVTYLWPLCSRSMPGNYTATSYKCKCVYLMVPSTPSSPPSSDMHTREIFLFPLESTSSSLWWWWWYRRFALPYGYQLPTPIIYLAHFIHGIENVIQFLYYNICLYYFSYSSSACSSLWKLFLWGIVIHSPYE